MDLQCAMIRILPIFLLHTIPFTDAYEGKIFPLIHRHPVAFGIQVPIFNMSHGSISLVVDHKYLQSIDKRV